MNIDSIYVWRSGTVSESIVASTAELNEDWGPTWSPLHIQSQQNKDPISSYFQVCLAMIPQSQKSTSHKLATPGVA